MDMETNRAMEVVGIGVPYYDMVINVSKMPGLDGAAGANEAFYQEEEGWLRPWLRRQGWDGVQVSSPG